MIGETIESPQSKSWGAIFFFVLGAAACILGVVLGQHHWFVGATLPLLLGCALWWGRDPAFAAEFTETGIEVHTPPQSVAYTDIEGLKTRGRPGDPMKPGPKAYAIHVLHREGVLRLPKRLNVPSDSVFHFLYTQFTPSGSREVNPVLRDYLARQEQEFGPQKVWTYRARGRLGGGEGRRRALLVCLALTLCGAAWLVAGLLDPKPPVWIVLGIIALILGPLFSIPFWSESGYRTLSRAYKKWQAAGLVISPSGLALVQGEVRGELRWDELRDVQLYRKPRNFQIGYENAMPGIHLRVAGATILILDIYDRPLAMIFERIQHCRQRET